MPGEHVAPVVQHLISIVTFVLSIETVLDKRFEPHDFSAKLIDSKDKEVLPPFGWNASFSRFRRYKLETLQDIGHKMIAGVPSRDFSTHCGLNDKLPVEEYKRLQRIESRMLQEQPEQRNESRAGRNVLL
jgi:hypothetical protein